MLVEICVGSSCHIKGSEKVVELFTNALSEHGLEGKVMLAGSFCLGQCSSYGVTVSVDGKIMGVAPAGFNNFFKTNVLDKLK